MAEPLDISQKRECRTHIRRRRSRTAQDRGSADFSHLIDLCAAAPRVLAYAALPGEPNIDAVIDALTARGTEVWLPVAGPAGTALSFGRVCGTIGELPRQGQWQIREPAAEAAPDEVFAPSPPQVVLVPGLAFSTSGVRLGNGGGYYDRTFGPQGEVPASRLASTSFVGVCFEEEFGLPVEAQPWDLIVGAVATESGLRRVTCR